MQNTSKQKAENKQKSTAKHPSNGLFYPLIGVSIPLCVIIGFLIGHFMDKAFNTSPIFLIIFIIFGVIAAYMQIFKLIKKE